MPLPGTLVNQIAAGEVIERPASVVKELVENCMDADASRIEIDIDGGGLEKILVRDNGSGIHPDDIRLAVMRHTTSKLRTREELETVMSLGFRGEALSSIASVSDFSITSRMEMERHGWKLDLKSQAAEPALVPAAHPAGTTVVIRNLFHTVPARRKFLRSERTEFLHILEIVKRLVMSRFEIDISLQHNGKMILTSPAIESGYQARIKSVMGSGFYNDAREIDARHGDMHLWGWLGGEKSARSQSDRQYLYLNNRVIRDRQLNHA
ncbi:MAG: DNA mismatch repair endonuclease MutL, partial [Gammaproteobacteria bacterium]